MLQNVAGCLSFMQFPASLPLRDTAPIPELLVTIKSSQIGKDGPARTQQNPMKNDRKIRCKTISRCKYSEALTANEIEIISCA